MFLTKRSAASGDENDLQHENRHVGMPRIYNCFILAFLNTVNKMADFLLCSISVYRSAFSSDLGMGPRTRRTKLFVLLVHMTMPVLYGSSLPSTEAVLYYGGIADYFLRDEIIFSLNHSKEKLI